MTRGSHLALVGIALSGAALSACSSMDSRPNVGPCPVAGVLSESARLVEISGAERHENVAFTGEIRGVDGFCRYVGKNPITMDITVDFGFGRGPKAESATRQYQYWVAVTRRDRAVIAKQTYAVDVKFDRNESVVTRRINIDGIEIPRAAETVSGGNFEIIVGFELTPDQLAFNRAGKRFRMLVE